MGKLHVLAVVISIFCSELVHSDDTCAADAGGSVSHERRLMKCLLENYDKSVRPVFNPEDTLNVTLEMNLLHLLSFDEQTKSIDLNTWIAKSWMDYQLKWDPRDYGNIDRLRIPKDNIWTPDIVLLNNAALNADYVIDKLTVVISTGQVYWIPHARLRAFCTPDMHRFPFDTQVCPVLFGSWTYDSKYVNLTTSSNATLQYYYDDHNEWKIIHYKVERQQYTYTSPDISDPGRMVVNEVYPYIQYTMTLKRSSTFYSAALVSPVVMLVILTNFLFFVPPHANERITLGIGIIISLSLVTVVICDYIPTHITELPVIFMYVLFDFVMTTFAILISILVYNFHHREYRKGKVPTVVRRIFLGFFRKVLCIKAEAYNSLPTDVPFVDTSGDMRYDFPAAQEMDTATPLPKSPTMALEKILDDIRKYLKQLYQQQQQQQQVNNNMPSHRQLVVSEWHQLAIVLDRLSVMIYVILTLLVSLSILH